MRWCPLSFRVSLENDSIFSGIYLVDPSSNNEIGIALSDKFLTLLSNSNNKALCALNATLDEVTWQDVELISSKQLHLVNKDLLNYSREFDVVPGKEISLLVFKFIDSSGRARRSRTATRPFNIFGAEERLPVSITSSPFGSAHLPLFHGYVTSGIVSLVRENLIFVDARYLNGMEGGIVNATGLGSIGLVGGSLAKSNGEGKLLFVVPWRTIAMHLPPEIALPKIIRHNETKRSASGVVAVVMKLKPNRISWGSGVLVSPNLVVTNRHVVGNNAEETIEVQADTTVRFVKHIYRPIDSVDLVVMELKSPFPTSTTPVQLAENDAAAETPVHAVGYGLFAPHRYGGTLAPLQSSGVVSNAVKGMIMSNASCWNGSSGGALLDDDGKLVGILSSNARDNMGGEIMPDISMSIPLSVVKEALNRVSQPGTLSSDATVTNQFKQLWKLDTRHRDVKPKRLGKL